MVTGTGLTHDLDSRGTVPQAQRSTAPGSRNVGDFFAPFFDIVFFTIDEEATEAARSIEEARAEVASDRTRTDLTVLTANKTIPGLTLAEAAEKRSIGSSQIRLSSTNGNVQVFSPDSDLAGIRNFKSNLTIDARASTAYKATLMLEPPYFDAIKLIDAGVIKFGSLMEIQWGYLSLATGEPLLSDKGLFTISEPSIRLGSKTSIVISGWDIISVSGSSLDRRCDWPREEFVCDALIIKKIAKTHKTEIIDLTDRSSSFLHENKEGQKIVQASDDFTFFHRLLVMNDVAFTIDGARIILRDLTTSDQLNPKYTLLYYSQPKKGTDIPMISFESNSIASLFGAPGSRGYLSTSYDLDEDEVIEEENLPEKAIDQPGDTNKLGTMNEALKSKPFAKQDKLCTSGKFIVKPHDRPNQFQERKIKARENRRQANTTATAIVPGHPSILPLDIVTVQGGEGFGVGKKFGGKYRVMRLVHDIGQSGYTTRIELLRAETSGSSTSTDPTADGQPNKKRDVSGVEGEEVFPELVLDAEPGEQACDDILTIDELLEDVDSGRSS